MRQEDIDKKISMPDVDAEWAKFEREVINSNTASRKPFYWVIGIAASIALVAGIFLFDHDVEAPQQLLAKQTPLSEKLQTPPFDGMGMTAPSVETSVSQNNTMRLNGYGSVVSDDSLEELEALQRRIAGLSIVPTSADMGSDAVRLTGIRIAGRDSVIIGRKPDYDFLVVINGQPLSEAEQKQMLSSDFHIYFFNRQQIVDSIYVYKDEDAKRPYVEKYGERAKNAVLTITTVPDTLCDAYVQKHPGLMQTLHRVEGYVIDEDTQKPLPDTWINFTWTINYKNVADTWIKHTDGAGAATDSTGHFILWLPGKDVKLQASRVGYKTVRINQPADTTLTIHMTDATQIKEVKIMPKTDIRIRGTKP